MKKALLSAVVLAAISSPAFADATGTISFTGEIVTGACGIDASSVNQTVQLGSVPANVFKKVGDKSTPVNFDIKLTECDTTTLKNAYFKFTGAGSSQNSKVIATTGSATGVGIRLQAASGEYLDNGSTQASPIVLQNGTNVVRFAAMYEGLVAADAAAKTGVTAGTADGVANFTLSYN